MSKLFSPLSVRGVTLENRIVVSPMCQYSATDGLPGNWHLVHLGSRAVGGAGTVFTEATAVLPEGRISPQDTGIWSDAHTEAWAPIAAFIREQGAVPAMQLAHAGFKASTHRPWDTEHGEISVARGGWEVVGPSTQPFSEDYPSPTSLDPAGIARVVEGFVAGARRALRAGFEVLEVHAAHGYLLHEFASPLSNKRTDAYGGSLQNRARLGREVIAAVRAEVGEQVPVFVRISATDWTEGGLRGEDSVQLAGLFAEAGADLVDVSTGGVVPKASIPVGPGYQVPFAAQIKREVGVPVGALGMITQPEQAEQILVTEQADVVIMARELLRDPYWPLRAAATLRAPASTPPQYERAF